MCFQWAVLCQVTRADRMGGKRTDGTCKAQQHRQQGEWALGSASPPPASRACGPPSALAHTQSIQRAETVAMSGGAGAGQPGGKGSAEHRTCLCLQPTICGARAQLFRHPQPAPHPGLCPARAPPNNPLQQLPPTCPPVSGIPSTFVWPKYPCGERMTTCKGRAGKRKSHASVFEIMKQQAG